MRGYRVFLTAGFLCLWATACAVATAPARDDTICRSGISISSGDKCGDQ